MARRACPRSRRAVTCADEDRFRDEHGKQPPSGEALWARPRRARAVCERAGLGIADDSSCTHVDDLVRLYLDQEPLLPSIPSRLLGPDDELDGLVVKPRGEMGGEGVVIWRRCRRGDARARARADRAEPGGWIGQELVELSVHRPCGRRARAAPRDLRPYARPVRRCARVLPAAIAEWRRARLDGGNSGRRRSEGHLGALNPQGGLTPLRVGISPASAPRDMCSVPSQCSLMSRTARAVSLRRSSATSRLCWAFEWLSTSSGCETRWI